MRESKRKRSEAKEREEERAKGKIQNMNQGSRIRDDNRKIKQQTEEK